MPSEPNAPEAARLCVPAGRKTAEDALRTSEDLTRRILEAVPGGIVHVAQDGAILRANAEAQRVLGMSFDELTKQFGPIFQRKTVLEDGRECAAEDDPVTKCLRTGQPQPGRTLGVCQPDGSISWAVFTALPIFDPETGQPSGAVVTFLDITQRKRAEAALRQSEEQFRAQYRGIPVPTYSWKRVGDELILVDCNDAAMKFTQGGVLRLLGKTATELYGEEPDILEHLVCCFQDRAPVHFEKSYRFRSIEATRFLSVRLVWIPPDLVMVHTEDISERKLAEDALRESEARLRLLTGQMPAILWTTDEQLRCTSSVGAGLAGLNLRPDEVMGKTLSEFFQIDDPNALPITAQRRALQGESFTYESEWRGRAFHVHVEPFRNTAGEITGSTGVALDITERKKAEEQLRLREKRFRALIENSSDGIALLGPDGTLQFLSPSVQRLFGYFPAMLIGRNAFEFVHPDDLQSLRERLQYLLEHPDEGIVARYRVLRHDGRWRWVEANQHNLLREPAVQAIVVNYRDITLRKQAEAERDQLFHEVETARDRMQLLSRRLVEVQETERRHIARELHDEIGQQLTALKLDLEQSVAQPAHASAGLQAALDKANRLLTVVRDLSLDLRPTMLDDLGLLPALHWHFDRHTNRGRLRVTFRHHGIEGRRFGPEIETAAYRIVQEALTNVVRHAGVDEMTVRLWATDETLSVQVEDHGAGFDVEQAFNADRSSGLSGMRERAALLGGHFTIESTPGAGAQLTAELPLRPNPAG